MYILLAIVKNRIKIKLKQQSIWYLDSQCLEKAAEVCVVSRWYIEYLDSQSLQKVERAVAY